MKTTLIAELIELADQIDELDPKTAEEIDALIKGASNYPDFGAGERRTKEYALFEQFRDGKITKEQYKTELKKLQDQARQATNVLQPQGKPQ